MLKVAAATVLFALTMCAPAHAKICGPTTEIDQLLGDMFGLDSIGVGLTPAGTAGEILVSEDGDWSFVLSTPDGLTCIVTIGINWQMGKDGSAPPPTKPEDSKDGT